jgi:NHLM bacteriocin system ABC transporter ATP-binding protein
MARTPTIYDHDAAATVPLWLLREKGKLVEVSGNQPLWLDDPKLAWIIFSGKLDVFGVQLHHGHDTGARQWLFRAETGQALFGFQSRPECPETALLVIGAPGTTLLQIERTRLQALTGDKTRGADIARFVNDWALEFTHALANSLLPRDYVALEPDQEITLRKGEAAFPPRGFLWVKHLQGNSCFLGIQGLPREIARGYLPVSRQTWLESTETTRLHAVTTETFLAEDPTWQGLDCYHALILESVCAQSRALQEQETRRLEAKATSDRAIVESALVRLSSPLQKEPSATLLTEQGRPVDPLLASCRQVGNALGIAICPPSKANLERAPDSPLDRITRASHVSKRRVILRGEWWRQDNGALLAFIGEREFEHPVALLPASPTRYELYDPVRPDRVRVTRQVASSLYPFAYTFYRPLPARPLALRDIWRFGLRGSRGDLWTFVLAGFAGSALGLFAPLATGWLFDDLIPSAARDPILHVFAALVMSAIASAVFQFVQGIALLRVQTRVSGSAQSAVWDRLLSLPVTFFREYSAGDLSSRAMGIDKMRRALAGTTISAIMSGTFSVANIGLMFYYSPRLALLGLGLLLLAVIALVLAGHTQIRHQRTRARIQGQIAGTILQFITGISKLRVAGAEGRAFAFWAKRFAQQKEVDDRAQTLANGLIVFNAAYPILGSMALFAVNSLPPEGSAALSPGDFVAFYVAFGQLLTAGLHASSAMLSASDIIPTYERVRPILQAVPEVDDVKADPGELSGAIDVDHIDFRYQRDGPRILQDVSMHIESGEFIALVGPSGSGKSTLLRLLLGFEQPQAGTILYDGQDLNELDVRAVRRQTGVVLQTGKLMHGSILDNIVGSSLLGAQDAWTAARLVGLDDDIKQMPMGVYTVIGTGGSTLSGGQRQRILIARAIVHRPRILIFDEATSALDNVTQAIVSQSLERIQATRIVIAHRLSTIKQAGRIFVLNRGRIVQTGTFDELSKQEGLFSDLAERQVA